MKAIAIVLAAFVVSACNRANYGQADNMVLCDPMSGKGFFVSPGAGETSFVKRAQSTDALCKQDAE